MPWFYHPLLPREQQIERAELDHNTAAAGWLPVDDAPEQPAEPVNDEQASAPLDHEKEI